jgi:hypothetical protein
MKSFYLSGCNKQAGPRCLHEKEWITSIIENARAEEIALFIKDNVGWPETIREYPKGFK